MFDPPTPPADALAFIDYLRDRPSSVLVAPGPRHWSLFIGRCQAAGAKGNLIPDACLAAPALESGTDWITTDRDFCRFAGLSRHHPLD